MAADDYMFMASRFNEQVKDDGSDKTQVELIEDQYEVTEEEMEEFVRAFNFEGKEAVAEEAADVLVTLFVLADRMDFDLREAYMLKMGYNLEKSGETDSNGKVVDDVGAEKPDFGVLFEDA